MRCPVCGEDCVRSACEIIGQIPAFFAGCTDCRMKILDKSNPPPPDAFHDPCRCGKRFIDEVFSQMYSILVREGVFSGKEPLREVGSPLLHPGYPVSAPPFLPSSSLVLLSPHVNKDVAGKMIEEVPEIRGIVKSAGYIPGVTDLSLQNPPRTYSLLAGCDVRANIFPTKEGPIVIYQQQSMIHIEFPRLHNPKISAVESRISLNRPGLFVDACCGAGTLGITGARLGVPHVVLNDTWFAAAYWAASNLLVNQEFFQVDTVNLLYGYEAMAEHPLRKEPVLVAETEGFQEIEVYHGDFLELPTILPHKTVLAAIDLFDKSSREESAKMLKQWVAQINGEAFIP